MSHFGSSRLTGQGLSEFCPPAGAGTGCLGFENQMGLRLSKHQFKQARPQKSRWQNSISMLLGTNNASL